MREEAKINFYRINKCGFYPWGEDLPLFGNNIGQVLKYLSDWVNQDGFCLEDTSTYQVKDEDQTLRTFCCDLKHDDVHGDYLLTTWNETPTTDGQVPSIASNSTIGSATVHLNPLPEGDIPGYATYFWFLPSENIFATVRFFRTLNGHPNLMRYLDGYLRHFSPYVLREENPNEDGDYTIIGYINPETKEAFDVLYPAFHSSPIRNPGEIDMIRENRTRITKIHRKASLKVDVKNETTLLQTLLRHVGIGEPPIQTQTANIDYALPFTPSGEELNDIIISWENTSGEGWNDVGFKIQGDDIKWLSKSLAKVSQDLNVERDNDEIYNSESLLNALTEKRDDLISYIGR